MKRNILITSAGNRVSLTRKFIEELKRVFHDGKVYTCDMVPELSPAGMITDRCFKVPACTSDDYLETLLTICVEYNICVIIPTIDTELAILAANKGILSKHGINVIVSDFDFVMTCLDKRKTSVFFHERKIAVPAPRDKNHPLYPMFAKPFDGSRSNNLHVIRNDEELTTEVRNDPKLIFMEYLNLDEYKEFTVDLYYGSDNYLKSIVPRERIEVRAGEVSKAITRKNFLVDYLKDKMWFVPGAVGSICIQLFYREKDNEVIGIEINPRFGGGYPLSYCAGANFPRMIIQEYLLGEMVDYSEGWRDGTLMLRYDEEVIVYAGEQ